MSEPTLYQLDDVLLTGYSLTDIRRLVRNGVLVPVEPDYEKMYDHIIKKLNINEEFTPQDAADVFETAIGGDDE